MIIYVSALRLLHVLYIAIRDMMGYLKWLCFVMSVSQHNVMLLNEGYVRILHQMKLHEELSEFGNLILAEVESSIRLI